jgi:hypothetical protein
VSDDCPGRPLPAKQRTHQARREVHASARRGAGARGEPRT